MRRKPILYAVLGSALALSFSPMLLAQSQDQNQESVADAARKAQAEKKAPAKPVKVYTNDDVDTVKGSISIVGPEPAAPASDAAAKTDKTAPADDKKPAVKDEAYWHMAFADARRKLADDEHELDILQREFNLKEQQYYSDPNTALREQYSRKDLDDTQAKIDEKKADVDKDNHAISDLEDALRQAGGDPGWSAEPPPPAPTQ